MTEIFSFFLNIFVRRMEVQASPIPALCFCTIFFGIYIFSRSLLPGLASKSLLPGLAGYNYLTHRPAHTPELFSSSPELLMSFKLFNA